MSIEAPPPSKTPHLLQLLRVAHTELNTSTGSYPPSPRKLIEKVIDELPQAIEEDMNTASIRTTIESRWNEEIDSESDVKYIARDCRVPVSFAAQIIRELDNDAEFTEEDLIELD